MIGNLVEVPLSGCGFPKVCAKCGTTTGLRLRKRVLTWESGQTSVDKLMMALATMGQVYMTGGNWRVPLHFPLCPRCNFAWASAGPLFLVSFFAPLLLAAAVFAVQPTDAGFAMPVAALVVGIALPVAVWFLFMRHAEVKIVEVKGDAVVLTGLGAAMRDAIQAVTDPTVFEPPEERVRKSVDIRIVLGVILVLLLIFAAAVVLLDPGPDRNMAVPPDVLGE